MTILITGANGQLGLDFRSLFKKNNIDFIITDILDPLNYLDITDINQLRFFVRNKNIDTIINCSAYNLVDKAETDSHTAFLINGIGVRNLAQVSNVIGARLIHFSTDYVFDGIKNAPYTFLDEPHPLSKYGESKLLGEKFIQQIAHDYLLIRTSWLIGNGPKNFIQNVLQWSSNKSELKIVTDEISNPTFTVDLALATLDLLNIQAQGLYHITNTDHCSRFEWAEFILNHIGWQGELIPSSSKDFNLPAKRPIFSSLDTFGLKESIGYELPSWKNATSKYLNLVNK